MCYDLVKSCKITWQQLFMYCSTKVCGMLTYLVILNSEATLALIDKYLGL